MPKDSANHYADVSDILVRKARGRKDISRRSFAEKIEMLEAMRLRLDHINLHRLNRRKRSEHKG